MRLYDSRACVDRSRRQKGTAAVRPARDTWISLLTVKSPSSLTVLTRLSAADHAPLLGEHIAGPYSNRVLSLYSLLPAIARCSLFSINTSHPSISLWEHRHERDHTDNESRETTVLRVVPDFMLYMCSRAWTIKSDRFLPFLSLRAWEWLYVKSINSIEFRVDRIR